MTSAIKYSILIPTRNGAKYLLSAIKSILDQEYSNCEVIISINHSEDNSLNLVNSIEDPRIKVIMPPKLLSMTKHFEWLLGHANGQWIAMLGDDDGLMPYFFEKCDHLLLSYPDTKAINSSAAVYYWPGHPGSPKVFDYHYSSKQKMVNSKLQLLLALSGVNSFSALPQIYNTSVIHQSVIQKIKQKSNNIFYNEAAPDVYSGVAIASTLKGYLKTKCPLFWCGISPKSNGLAHILRSTKEETVDMSTRVDEFDHLNHIQQIKISNKVDPILWKHGIGPVHVYSALHMLPFKTVYTNMKWIDYLVHGFIILKIKATQNLFEKESLKRCLKKQIQINKLNPIILWFFNFLPASFLKRRFRAKRKPSKNTIYSMDHEKYPNILAASEDALKIYRQQNP